jgi:predicted Zn finger-like uncharacterized protein
MKISCQSCAAKYTIADDKVRGKTVKIKCKKCGSAIVVGPDTPDDAASSASALPPDTSSDWMVNMGEGDQRTLSLPQIVELYNQGVISEETYLWRDGMSDWQPLRQVDEVRSALGGGAGAPGGASAADEMDDGLPTQMAQIPAQLLAQMGARPAAGAPAARRSEGQKPAVDLFSPPAAQQDDEEEDATRVGSTAELGTSNLFGAVGPSPAAGAPAARRAPMAAAPAPMSPSMGREMAEPAMAGAGAGNEASGLIDIRKLQSALKKPEPNKKQEENLDDIMNMGGGSPLFSPGVNPMMAPPAFDQPPPPEQMAVAAGPAQPMAPLPAASKPKSNTGLIVGLIVGLLALGGIGMGAMFMMGQKNAEQLAAATDAAAKAKADADKVAQAPADKKDDDKKADGDKKADEKKPDEKVAAADDKDDDTSFEAQKEIAALTPEEKKRRAEALKKKLEEREAKKKEEAEKKKKAEEDEKKKKEAEAASAAGTPAAGGGGDKPFDRGAASAALGAAAGAAQSCKKADGPTGSGRVSVTFAPSGNATTANVEGPPFAGTSVGGCVAAKFRAAKVPPFSGGAFRVGKSFTIN